MLESFALPKLRGKPWLEQQKFSLPKLGQHPKWELGDAMGRDRVEVLWGRDIKGEGVQKRKFKITALPQVVGARGWGGRVAGGGFLGGPRSSSKAYGYRCEERETRGSRGH